MAPPAALLPDPEPEVTTSELTNNGILRNIEKTAPSSLEALKQNGIKVLKSLNAVKDDDKIVDGVHVTKESAPALAELDASKLITTLTFSPQPVPEPNSPEVLSQSTCTDHMLTATFNYKTGWSNPQITPTGPLTFAPTASCLHYGTSCFEGMKLYRGQDGRLRLFRPNLNAARMLGSATRVALPAFDPVELEKLVIKLCARDGPRWLPRERGEGFLYVRPTIVGSAKALGVGRPQEAMMFTIITMFPSMDDKKTGLRLLASKDDMCRAWPGGFGNAKVGANYGPTLAAQAEAREQGFDQILWLFGPDGEVTESGASNFFVVWRPKEGGKLQLVTAPLDDKIILDGVTRRSLLQLAWERLSEEVEVVERKFTIGEVKAAIDEGRMVEVFTSGTAFFIAPVSEISYRGSSLFVPMSEGSSGKYAALLKTWMRDIMYGREQHPWGVVVEEY